MRQGMQLLAMARWWEARQHGPNDRLGVADVLDRYRVDSGRPDRGVIASVVKRVANEHHFLCSKARDLFELGEPLSLVETLARYVERGRPANADGKVSKLRLKRGFQLPAFTKIGIPTLLGLERRQLPKPRKGDLATPILDSVAPARSIFKSERRERLSQCRQDVSTLDVRQNICIDLSPAAVEPVKLATGRWQQEEPG